MTQGDSILSISESSLIVLPSSLSPTNFVEKRRRRSFSKLEEQIIAKVLPTPLVGIKRKHMSRRGFLQEEQSCTHQTVTRCRPQSLHSGKTASFAASKGTFQSARLSASTARRWLCGSQIPLSCELISRPKTPGHHNQVTDSLL